jgi:hypothetical protein
MFAPREKIMVEKLLRIEGSFGEKTVAERLLRFDWEGPLTLEAALAKRREYDCGLYQIYSHSLVYACGTSMGTK